MGHTNVYTQQRQTKSSIRTAVFVLAAGVILTLTFLPQLYGWLLGHPITIGDPILRLTQRGQTVLYIVEFTLFCGAFAAFLYQKMRAGSFCLLLALIFSNLSFEYVYNPIALETIMWYPSYWDVPQLQTANTYLLTGGIFYLTITTFSIWYLFRPTGFEASGSHGTAKIEKGNQFIQDHGLLLARHSDNKKWLRYNGDGHLLTLAQTRGGKGSAAIIPNLLSYPHNIIQVDPKGENCNITYRYRKEVLGQEINVLDPFYITTYAQKHGTGSLNLLDNIEPGNTEGIDYAAQLASAIAFKDPDFKGDPHWITEAQEFISGLIFYIANAPEYNNPEHPDYKKFGREKRHLGEVRRIIMKPKDKLEKWCERLTNSNLNPLLKEFAHNLFDKEERELSGVLSSIRNSTRFLRSPAITETFTESSIDLKEVLREPSTLYIVLPQNKLDTYSRWLRLVITTILNKASSISNSAQLTKTNERVLFSIDEVANLGNLAILKKGYKMSAGYGISFWIFIQDIPDFKKLYGDAWETFTANSDVTQMISANDTQTMKYFSELAGDTTIISEGSSENKRKGAVGVDTHSGSSESASERSRRLFTPHEIRTLNSDDLLLFPLNKNVVQAKKSYYWQDDYFEGRYTTLEEVDRELKELKDSGKGSEYFDIVIEEKIESEGSQEQTKLDFKEDSIEEEFDNLSEEEINASGAVSE